MSKEKGHEASLLHFFFFLQEFHFRSQEGGFEGSEEKFKVCFLLIFFVDCETFFRLCRSVDCIALLRSLFFRSGNAPVK